MELISDGVLIIAATVAGLYCLVLSRRLHSLTQLESGLGKAITGMSDQVDELKEALSNAKTSTEGSARALGDQLKAAEFVADKLESLLRASKERESFGDRAAPVAASEDDRSIPAERTLNRTRRKAPAEEDEASGRKRIDGLISSYLNEFEGEDEAVIARRLVAALTSAELAGKGCAI